MRRAASLCRKLRTREDGATVVEFALLAPVFFAALIGLLETGLYMQNFNAVRSLASDSARFAAVEYQKENNLTKDLLKTNIEAMAVQSPYNLNPSRLVVAVENDVTTITGAKKFDLDVTYTPAGFLENLGMPNFKITYSRPLFVIDNAYVPPS